MKTEQVKFRLYDMPCCGHSLCWVNPRPPTFCPECGRLVFDKLKGRELVIDDEAILRLTA